MAPSDEGATCFYALCEVEPLLQEDICDEIEGRGVHQLDTERDQNKLLDHRLEVCSGQVEIVIHLPNAHVDIRRHYLRNKAMSRKNTTDISTLWFAKLCPMDMAA